VAGGGGGPDDVKSLPSDFQVKCANCGSYFKLDEVHTYDHGYYCHLCHEKLRSQQRTQSKKEVKCGVCGKVLAPDGTRVQYYNESYCIACYDKSFPNLKTKAGKLQIGDTLASLRTTYKPVLCASCSRDLGPLDIKVRDGGAIYCDRCYEKVRKAPDRGISEATRKSEFYHSYDTTVLRQPDKLIECSHCGRVYTIDGLAADERGKYLCPVCGKDLDVRPRAPVKERPEKKKPEPLAKEDFAMTAQLFKCLADPCRVKIIESLSEKELNVFAFVEITGAQYSLTSYHLKVLKELGLIKSYKRGNFVVYSLTDKGEAVHEFIQKSRGLT
jgi:DNA-binding transcriptional ArsR family regulator/ribosomal protein S27E